MNPEQLDRRSLTYLAITLGIVLTLSVGSLVLEIWRSGHRHRRWAIPSGIGVLALIGGMIVAMAQRVPTVPMAVWNQLGANTLGLSILIAIAANVLRRMGATDTGWWGMIALISVAFQMAFPYMGIRN